MSKLDKLFKTLRNNWKKSIFFTGLAIWGANFGHKKYLEFNLMKAYCQEAVKYGEEKLEPFRKARHITVLLNPVSNRQYGKRDYEKYCAPLFHLAGLKVSLVVIEAEGQVKDLMEIMDNTDCVVLVGGDGTIHEAITGLLRRPDSQKASQRFPIGIIPIGKNNSIAYKLNSDIFDPDKDLKAKILAESSMAIIRQTLQKVDVMKIKGERGKPVYSLGSLNMGQLQNVILKVDQYWYLGQRIKPYLAFFFQSFKDLTSKWDENKEISIEYTKPCSGCSKCFHRFETNQPEIVQTDTSNKKRWWHSFVPRNRSAPVVDPILEAHRQMINKMKDTINEECDQWQKLAVKTKNILVYDTYDNAIEVIIHPEDLTRSAFIDEGIRMFNKKKLRTLPVIKAKDCRIQNMILEDVEKKSKTEMYVNSKQESSFSLMEQIVEDRPNAIKELDQSNTETTSGNQMDVNQVPNNNETNDENIRWISIDNEKYEIQSNIEISILPMSVQIYRPIVNQR